MFKRILIANRGEIACRVMKTAKRMGIETVAVFSEPDRHSLHVSLADDAVCIGPAPAIDSYLSIPRILEAVRQTKAEAVHPGYGFLSENKDFALALGEEKVVFIGPPAGAIEAMGDKIQSKLIAASADVSTIPGNNEVIASVNAALEAARSIGYPVMIKASAGGGGKGMRVAWKDDDVYAGYLASKHEAAGAFGDDRIFLERYITGPRHIEIQILADQYGNCIFLNERECSIQRRNQKVIEEAPSPFLDAATRISMGEQAVRLAKAVDYCSAGTVEFVVDAQKNFYFLEMNTRLQVEHPVTELISNVDLVEQMIRIAHGEKLALSQSDVAINGWAMESRIYAEDPARGFLPSIGRLVRYRPPIEMQDEAAIVRNDTGVVEGGEISVHYDPMIAKLCSWADSRPGAIEIMRGALDRFEIEGVSCNIPFLSTVLDHPVFIQGDATTSFVEDEFPEGLSPRQLPEVTIRQLAAAAGLMHKFSLTRNADISGRMSLNPLPIADEWVVEIDGYQWRLHIIPEGTRTFVRFEDGPQWQVYVDWQPGKRLAYLSIDEQHRIVRICAMTCGFRMSYRGADLAVRVRSPREAELAQYMPAEKKPDISAKLLCPMPGLLVSIDVAPGDEVESGQNLCVMEAMKMENVLKSDRKAVVQSVHAQPGDSLAVDDVILEFETSD
ncbi:MAG: acetyl/propionyl/methylcrotonyl-CoA carboxylase subunit alpha [Rhodobacteraceae bacterium]|nr:acetyl/propionyl/methylcrotonyl-CoA carboxylase subunit alpha [Paracoccaceae bacterium]